MKASDVTEILDLALQASGCGQVHVEHKPRLLFDNGSSYVTGELAEWLEDHAMKRSPLSSPDTKQDRAMALDSEKPHLNENYSDEGHINIGLGEEVLIGDLTKSISRTVGFNGSLEFNTKFPDGTPGNSSTVRKLCSLFGKPKWDWKKG
jgi:hypothetical protein